MNVHPTDLPGYGRFDRTISLSPPETREQATDPARIRTGNGVVWTRREGSRGGRALYAPEHVGSCPRLVMSTVPELEAQGVTVGVAA